MCGITLYISKNDENMAVKEVLSSLYELQNRGYDSFGIAYYNKEIDDYQIYKKSIHCTSGDTYKELYEETKEIRSSICIGHSRWATHGKVNATNAHPHVSNQKLFYLIHNGIIENYKELKDFLGEKGYTFYSETDTEIIVNLIEYFYLYETEKNTKESIYKAVRLLEGTYGLIILNKENPNLAYLIKQGSPLLISETENEILATSELCGFQKHTNHYYEIDNNELIILSQNQGILYEEANSYIIKKEIDSQFTCNYLTQELGNYTHYTQKEIMEQDHSLFLSLNRGARIMEGSICLGGLQQLSSNIHKIQNIIFLGCGSSYYASCIGYVYLKEIINLRYLNVFCFDAGDFEISQIPHGVCLFVFISQSGETMDLIKHLHYIQQNHYTMGIINVIDSTIAKEVDCGIYMNVGKEVAVASTKSFNSSVLLLKLFSLWFYQEKTKTKFPLTSIDLLEMINYVKEQTIQINQMIYQIKKVNHEINVIFERGNLDRFIFEHIFILGKGSMEHIAKECALKLKEICYIHGEGLSAASLKHGPLAMIHRDFPVILLINHENIDKMMNTYHELMSRDAYVFIVTSESDLISRLDKESKQCDIILIPKNKTCSEILFMLTLQYLCYHLSIRKKINPDKPKNLAKVVTVE